MIKCLPDVLTAAETSAYLRISEALFYRLAQEGEVPAVRVGRVWRVRRDLLDEWLDRRMWANLTACKEQDK